MALNYQQSGSDSTRRVLFVVLLIVALVLAGMYSREDQDGLLHRIQGAVGVVASPAQYAGSHVGSSIESVATSIDDLTADPSTLSELREQNQQLRRLLAEADEYRIEIERLRSLLDIKENSGITGVAAQVVGASAEAWNKSVTINKGSADGITTGMTVMGSSGVVGQVVGVSDHLATVRLLTDPNSGAAVMIQSGRANGIVRGSLEGLLYLEDVSEEVIPVVGDVVVTSGLGGSYTSGLMVGMVVSVEKTTANATGRIVVKPNDDIAQLEDVIVVTGFASDAQSQ